MVEHYSIIFDKVTCTSVYWVRIAKLVKWVVWHLAWVPFTWTVFRPSVDQALQINCLSCKSRLVHRARVDRTASKKKAHPIDIWWEEIRVTGVFCTVKRWNVWIPLLSSYLFTAKHASIFLPVSMIPEYTDWWVKTSPILCYFRW